MNQLTLALDFTAEHTRRFRAHMSRCVNVGCTRCSGADLPNQGRNGDIPWFSAAT